MCHFAKWLLAFQSSWALISNCGLCVYSSTDILQVMVRLPVRWLISVFQRIWRAPTSSAVNNPQFALRAQELCEAWHDFIQLSNQSTQLLASFCETRHGYAKSSQEVASIGSVTEYLDAISCVDFSKPHLASQSSWARRANSGLLHYWLEPFIFSWLAGTITFMRLWLSNFEFLVGIVFNFLNAAVVVPND